MGKIHKNSSVEHKSEIAISDLFANIPGHIYAKDQYGTYLAANDRDEFSCSIDGTRKGNELIGKTDKDFPWKDVAGVLQRNDQEVMLSGKTKVFIEQGKLKDGNLAIVISIKSPLRNINGDIIGIIGNSIELTAEVKDTLKSLIF